MWNTDRIILLCTLAAVILLASRQREWSLGVAIFAAALVTMDIMTYHSFTTTAPRHHATTRRSIAYHLPTDCHEEAGRGGDDEDGGDDETDIFQGHEPYTGSESLNNRFRANVRSAATARAKLHRIVPRTRYYRSTTGNQSSGSLGQDRS